MSEKKDKIRRIIESNEDYKKAYLLKQEFEPKKEINYKWIYDYALTQYERVEDTFKTLDNKADFMIKCLVPGSGILGLVITIITTYATCIIFGIIGIVGIILLICSLIFSVLSLRPGKYYLPPSIKQAIQTAQYYKNEECSYGFFSTGIAVTIEENMIINDLKAKLIKYSYWIFIIGIIWLFIILPLSYILL